MLRPINQKGERSVAYLRISQGAIISKKDGAVTSFSAISGAVRGIVLKEHEFENKKFRNWHITISDVASNEVYDLAVSRGSGAFKSIVRSLVTQQGLDNLDDVTIEVYTSKNGYTNASVSAGGQRLSWSDEQMPAISYVKVGDCQVADDSAQMNWIQTLVDRINARISNEGTVFQDDDDLPFGDE